MDPRPLYDTALALYLALFFVLAAGLMRRESRLGWAMFGVFATLGTLFVYALVARLIPATDTLFYVGIAIRAVLALAMTWASVELVRQRRT